MTTRVLTAGPSATVGEAARLMLERRVGSILIVNGRRPIGILTGRDLVRVTASGVDAAACPVSEYMTCDPDTTRPDEEAIDVFRRFALRGYRHVPVVEGGELVGIVSMRDLFMKLQRGPTASRDGGPLAAPHGRDITELTLLSVLENGRGSDHAVIVPDGPQITYRQLRSQVQQVADTLAAVGVERADRVAIVLPQGPLAIVAILGTTLAATAAPL